MSSKPNGSQEDSADGKFENKRAAETRLAEVKAALPEVESAYVSSGTMPTTALLLMMIGGVVGALGGSVVSAVAGGVWALLVMMFGAIGDAFWESGWIAYVPYTLMGVIAGIGFFALYALAGAVAAACVTFAGRIGKNRNLPMPKLIAVIAAAAAGAVCHFTLVQTWLPFMYNPPEDTTVGTIAEVMLMPWAIWTAAALGAITAVLVANATADGMVKAARYSETHGQYMKRRYPSPLNFDGAAALANAMNSGDIEAAATALAKTGERARVTLFALPGGEEGYLELEYDFEATFLEKPEHPADNEPAAEPSEDTLEESWLAGSWHLNAPQTAVLTAAVEKK